METVADEMLYAAYQGLWQRQIDMAGKHLLCQAHNFGTSCRLLHEPLTLTPQH